MNDIIESSTYHLTKKDEEESIEDINKLLENFETLLKLTAFDMNSRKVLDASLISESMLNLLLKKEGYLLKDNTNFSEIIIFCSNNNILPLECVKFIDIIRIYKENVVKGIETTNELTNSFLDAFSAYISWFKKYYSNKYNPNNEFKIDRCCLLINPNNKRLRLNSIDSAVKRNSTHSFKKLSSYCPKCNAKVEDKNSKFCMFCGSPLNFTNKNERGKHSRVIQSHFNQINQDELLEQLQKQNDSLKEILESVLKTQKMVEDINAKIDIITNNLTRIQSQSEKLINSAWSEEEIDRIIQIHTSECVETIMEYQSDITKDNQYEEEKSRLVQNFGKSWEKLSNEAKNLLITSKFMFKKLEKIDENMDYSGICILVTKALEVEIFKRFFTDFLEYLDERYNKNYSEYPTSLLFRYQQPLFPERFTMGNIAFVLCYSENYRDTPEQIKNNKIKLIEYCQSNIFSGKRKEEIEELLNSYASSIEDIRVRFRNPSAHRGEIKKTTAEKCFEIIIDVEKLLVKMLDSFDY